jgi:hypothetical protein
MARRLRVRRTEQALPDTTRQLPDRLVKIFHHQAQFVTAGITSTARHPDLQHETIPIDVIELIVYIRFNSCTLTLT